MDLSALQDQIDALSAQITKQGAEVRTLKKADSTDADAISAAVQVLQNLKIDHKKLVDQMEEVSGGSDAFNRQVFDDLVLRKMFVIPSFEIHGGVKGLFDLGPPACALKVSSFVWDFWWASFYLYACRAIRLIFILRLLMKSKRLPCLIPGVSTSSSTKTCSKWNVHASHPSLY